MIDPVLNAIDVSTSMLTTSIIAALTVMVVLDIEILTLGMLRRGVPS